MQKYPKLFEFRIKYNAGDFHSAVDSYHYYSAESAEEAFEFHRNIAQKRGHKMQNISIEKKDPYQNIWEDCSQILTENQQ